MLLNRPFSVITPTVDGDVLTVLARTERFLTAGQVHRSAGRWSVNGIRNALVRLSTHGLVTAENSGPVPKYALNREHLAANAVLEIAHLPRRLASRLSRELEQWEDPPSYASLFDSDGTPGVLLVRPEHLQPGTDASSGWAADVATLRRTASLWTGSDVRVVEMSHTEVRHGLGQGLPLLTEVRRDGVLLAGDELLLWRRT